MEIACFNIASLAMEIIIILSFILCLLGKNSFALQIDYPSIWPMPTNFTFGDEEIILKKLNFVTLDADGNVQTILTLENVYSRYNSLIFGEHSEISRQLDGKTVISTSQKSKILPALNSNVLVQIVDTSEAYPQYETDESYELQIPSGNDDNILVKANTIYGAMRGIETMSQLIFYDFEYGSNIITAAPIHVSDTPRYAHRYNHTLKYIKTNVITICD